MSASKKDESRFDPDVAVKSIYDMCLERITPPPVYDHTTIQLRSILALRFAIMQCKVRPDMEEAVRQFSIKTIRKCTRIMACDSPGLIEQVGAAIAAERAAMLAERNSIWANQDSLDATKVAAERVQATDFATYAAAADDLLDSPPA